MAKSNSNSPKSRRLEVLKTYKMYVGGKFPRTESGRFYTPMHNDKPLANICHGSRKDLRNAVVAARDAQSGWAGRTAYNRGQILYRIGEMLEGRSDQFIGELKMMGFSAADAKAEVESSIDRLIYYAGWCDKYQQIFSSVNPVSSSHFNFSVLEPMGVVVQLASESSPLLGLVSLAAPIIASGNTCVILASESRPLSAVTFGEVVNSSDVPGGVVNILTGFRSELIEHVSTHMDINAVAYDGAEEGHLKLLAENSVSNLKRIRSYQRDWADESAACPYLIQEFCETKTTWHPIEKISASGSGY